MEGQTIEQIKHEMEIIANEIPLLPLPKEAAPRQLALGEVLKLDELGPIIINSDGTTRRITNWDTLSTQERESSWRLIGARNKKRIEELKKLYIEKEAHPADTTESNSHETKEQPLAIEDALGQSLN